MTARLGRDCPSPVTVNVMTSVTPGPGSGALGQRLVPA